MLGNLSWCVQGNSDYQEQQIKFENVKLLTASLHSFSDSFTKSSSGLILPYTSKFLFTTSSKATTAFLLFSFNYQSAQHQTHTASAFLFSHHLQQDVHSSPFHNNTLLFSPLTSTVPVHYKPRSIKLAVKVALAGRQIVANHQPAGRVPKGKIWLQSLFHSVQCFIKKFN